MGKHLKRTQGPWPGASMSVRRLDQHCPAAKTTIGANTFFDVSEWRRRPLPIMSLSTGAIIILRAAYYVTSTTNGLQRIIIVVINY